MIEFAPSPRKKRMVNMTSLVDVVFLLLIFFMLSTNFIKHYGMNLEVPQPSGKTSSWQGAILIRPNINTVLINSKKVSLLEMPSILRAMLKQSPNPNVIIKPYKNVPLQTTVAILDQVRQLGIQKISLIP